MLKVTIFGADRNHSLSESLAYENMHNLLIAARFKVVSSDKFGVLSLRNVQKIVQSTEAFVFLPNANFEDIFYAISIFVGYQTLDPELKGKPVVILNSDGSWDPMFKLLDQLEIFGTIRQDYRKFLLRATDPKEALNILSNATSVGVPDSGRKKIISGSSKSFETIAPAHTNGKICVFCSASTNTEDYIKDGYALGKLLADHNYGCVSGAGTTGVMGSVVRGSVDAGGWTAGSNVPHIIEIEGLPKGLSSFWLRPDIYARMDAMIEKSDAFIIFPGGAGTVQELMALLIFKISGNPLMIKKPIIIFNRIDKQLKAPFWDKLITLINIFCDKEYYNVVSELKEIIPAIEQTLKS